MIQFWITDETTPISSDVTIRGNRLMSGQGGALHSIFMRNGAVDKNGFGSEMFYQNISITNNLISNGNYHGITVGATNGLTIQHNTVLRDLTSGQTDPRVNIAGDAINVKIDHNILLNELGADESGWAVGNNLLVQHDSPSLPNYYADLFINAMNEQAGPEDLQAIPGGLIEQGGYGAAITRYNSAPESLTAVIREEGTTGVHSLFNFDGSLTADQNGRVDVGEAHFLWDFGDGGKDEGIKVSHDYAKPGDYVTTLTVVEADGSQDVTHSTVHVSDPVLLNVDVTNGHLIDNSSYASPINESGLTFESGRNGEQTAHLDADSYFTFNRQDVTQIYDLDEFSLSFGFRAEAPGAILDIYSALKIGLDSSGQITVDLTNADEKSFSLTSSRGLLDDKWHDVTISFDGSKGELDFYVDGAEVSSGEAWGRTQPLEHWGLLIGGGWGHGFTGELDSLELHSETLDPAEIAAIAEQNGTLAPATDSPLQ